MGTASDAEGRTPRKPEPYFWFPGEGSSRSRGAQARSAEAAYESGVGLSGTDATQAVLGAWAQTSHLCVGAHPDDLEILGAHGILECYERGDRGFFGVVVCDGAGSAREGAYQAVSDEEMVAVREREQIRAAGLGDYAGLCLLRYPSERARTGWTQVGHDLFQLLQRAQPQVVYTHSPLDQHETHVAVAAATIAALRRLPPSERPARVIGCEVWGGLDFMETPARVELDVSARPHLQAALLGAHDSQISGGKRYDLATLGRRRAQATFSRSHRVDEQSGLILGVDLMPLLTDPDLSLSDFAAQLMDETRARILERLARFGAVPKMDS